MDGHTLQGQIWTVPVKKVNPESLTGARKSGRDGPDSQSARGSRLSAREQVQIHQLSGHILPPPL